MHATSHEEIKLVSLLVEAHTRLCMYGGRVQRARMKDKEGGRVVTGPGYVTR